MFDIYLLYFIENNFDVLVINQKYCQLCICMIYLFLHKNELNPCEAQKMKGCFFLNFKTLFYIHIKQNLNIWWYNLVISKYLFYVFSLLMTLLQTSYLLFRKYVKCSVIVTISTLKYFVIQNIFYLVMQTRNFIYLIFTYIFTNSGYYSFAFNRKTDRCTFVELRLVAPFSLLK